MSSFVWKNLIKFKKIYEIILTKNDYRSREEKTFYKTWLSYSIAKYEIAKRHHVSWLNIIGGDIGEVISSYLNDSANERFYTFAFELFGERLFIEAYFLTFIQHRDEQREGIKGHESITSHFFCNLSLVHQLAESNM